MRQSKEEVHHCWTNLVSPLFSHQPRHERRRWRRAGNGYEIKVFSLDMFSSEGSTLVKCHHHHLGLYFFFCFILPISWGNLQHDAISIGNERLGSYSPSMMDEALSERELLNNNSSQSDSHYDILMIGNDHLCQKQCRRLRSWKRKYKDDDTKWGRIMEEALWLEQEKRWKLLRNMKKDKHHDHTEATYSLSNWLVRPNLEQHWGFVLKLLIS